MTSEDWLLILLGFASGYACCLLLAERVIRDKDQQIAELFEKWTPKEHTETYRLLWEESQQRLRNYLTADTEGSRQPMTSIIKLWRKWRGFLVWFAPTAVLLCWFMRSTCQ